MSAQVAAASSIWVSARVERCPEQWKDELTLDHRQITWYVDPRRTCGLAAGPGASHHATTDTGTQDYGLSVSSFRRHLHRPAQIAFKDFGRTYGVLGTLLGLMDSTWPSGFGYQQRPGHAERSGRLAFFAQVELDALLGTSIGPAGQYQCNFAYMKAYTHCQPR